MTRLGGRAARAVALLAAAAGLALGAGAQAAQSGVALHRAAAIPNGVYVVTTTVADLRAGGVVGKDFNKAVTYVTTMHNGRWSQIQKPNYPDQGPFSGTYAVHGNEVLFVMLKAGAHGQNSVVAPELVKWSYFQRKLRFKIVRVADPDSVVIYTAHPWIKIR
jgi:hypothetical protein